jgi:hypothetical protein
MNFTLPVRSFSSYFSVGPGETITGISWDGFTRFLQLVTFCFRTIKSWSGFADDFWSPNSKCSAKNASF